jgi:sugar (pentulose or hexulose) kinase
MAEGAPGLTSFVDPDDERFLAPGDMPERIRGYCRDTGQPVPETVGAVARCILESLALKYRQVFGMLESLAGHPLPRLHMVGGGIQNALLCQWAADACGCEVLAGPVEATALGNAAVQLMAAGHVDGLAAARRVIRASENPVVYKPRERTAWDAAFQEYLKRTAR